MSNSHHGTSIVRSGFKKGAGTASCPRVLSQPRNFTGRALRATRSGLPGLRGLSTHDHARARAGVRVVFYHDNTIHDDGDESGGVMMRVAEGRVVLHRRGVENNQIGPVAFPYLAPVLEAKRGGRERRHPAYR